MKYIKFPIILLGIFFVLGNIKALETKPHIIEIKDAWLRFNINNLNFCSLYFVIKNTGKNTDYLLKVESEIAEFTEIEKSVIENNISTVINLNKVAIPHNSEVNFFPGGIFVFMKKIKKNLILDEEIKLKFYFENSIPIIAKARVKNN